MESNRIIFWQALPEVAAVIAYNQERWQCDVQMIDLSAKVGFMLGQYQQGYLTA